MIRPGILRAIFGFVDRKPACGPPYPSGTWRERAGYGQVLWKASRSVVSAPDDGSLLESLRLARKVLAERLKQMSTMIVSGEGLEQMVRSKPTSAPRRLERGRSSSNLPTASCPRHISRCLSHLPHPCLSPWSVFSHAAARRLARLRTDAC